MTFDNIEQFIETVTERFNKPRRSEIAEGFDKFDLLQSLIDVANYVYDTNTQEHVVAAMLELVNLKNSAENAVGDAQDEVLKAKTEVANAEAIRVATGLIQSIVAQDKTATEGFKNQAQILLNNALSLSNPQGEYNALTNSPALFAIPVAGANGTYFEITESGIAAFNGSNFTSGVTLLSAGGKLIKKNDGQYLYQKPSDLSLVKSLENKTSLETPNIAENLVINGSKMTTYPLFNVTTGVIEDAVGLNLGTRITESAINGDHYVTCGNTINLINGITHTFSVYAKAGTKGTIALTLSTSATWGGSGVPEIRVDLATGLFTKTAQATSADVIKLGNGWYRIYVTSTTHITGPTQVRLRLTNGGAAYSYLGDVSKYADFCYLQVSKTNGPIRYTHTYDTPVIKQGTQLSTLEQQIAWTNKVNNNDVKIQIGKNKFNAANSKDGFYLNFGVESANAAYGYGQDYIDVVAGQVYTAWGGTQGARFITFYNSLKSYVSSITVATKTFTIPADLDITFMRLSHFVGEKNTFQVELNATNTVFEPYSATLKTILGAGVTAIAAEVLTDPGHRFITDEQLAAFIAKLGPDAVISAPSKNLFDFTKGTDGFTLNVDGSQQANGAYGYSDFMPVVAGAQYTGAGASSIMRRIHFYSGTSIGSKTYLSYIDNPTNPVTIPVGATFTRATYSVGDKATFQFEQGNVKTGYTSFTPTLLSVLGAKVPDMSLVYSANIALPSRVYALVGREFNLYYDAFTLLPEYGSGVPNFLFDITCSKGTMWYRSFRFTPVAGDVGTYLLTFNILDNKGLIIDTATTTLVVVAAVNPSTVKHHLDVGDSTVDNIYLTSTIQSNLAALGGNVPIFHGQHYAAPGKNEARTGRAWGSFAGVAGVIAYKFYVSGVSPTLDLSNIRNTYYSHGTNSNQVILSERWKIESDGTGYIIGYYFGSFTIPTVFPTVLNAQAVDPGYPATINVTNAETLNGFSIFKNADGMGVLDISYYRQTVLGMASGTKFDSVRFDLGLNDLSTGTIATDAQITTVINNAKLVINAFIADNANCKIVVALPKSHTSDYYITSRKQSVYRISLQKLRKALIANFDFNVNYPNVYISQSGYSIDRFYGYPNSAQTPSARIATPTFVGTTDDVHPSQAGYQQNADGATGCLLYVLSLP